MRELGLGIGLKERFFASATKGGEMVTILSAVICLHHLCTVIIVPTPVSYTEGTCHQFGYVTAAEYAPRNWRVIGHYCEKGYEV